jgi:nitrogen fixation NifU-like protein
MEYSDLVMEHFMNPRNVGIIEDADGVGREGNPVCGDLMEIYLKVNDGHIADIKFRTFGCGAAIATSSIATEMVKGKPLSEAEALTNRAIADALGGLPSIKMHCSVLAAGALKRAIEDYYEKHPEARTGDNSSQ